MKLAPLLLGLLSLSACPGTPRERPARLAAPAAGAPPCSRLLPYSPALAQLLLELGLWDRVVGVPTWTTLPPGDPRPFVGDLRFVESERVLALKPTCILTQFTGREAFRGVLAAAPEIRIEAFDLERLDDVRQAALRIGAMTGTSERARQAVATFDERLGRLRQRAAGLPQPRALFVAAMDHLLVAGRGSYIAELMELAGATNAGAGIASSWSWPEVDHESIMAAQPEVLIHLVTSLEDKPRAVAYWKRWPTFTAERNGAVFVLFEPAWMTPSLDLAVVGERLFDILHRPS